MNGINEQLFTIGLFVIFITVIVGGVFVGQVAVLWLKNKREQREHDDRNRELDRKDQYEAERAAWVSVIVEKDKLIVGLNEELRQMTRECDRIKELMAKVNLKGEEI